MKYLVEGSRENSYPVYWTGVGLSRLPKDAFMCDELDFAESHATQLNTELVAWTFYVVPMPDQRITPGKVILSRQSLSGD
jgi:hypothetical protein